MREVVDGVLEIPIGYVNAYAVVVDDGVVLIDTGIPGRADKVANAVEAARHRIGEVHTILLTHWHLDHVGSVAELRRRSGARIVAHSVDAPSHLRREEPNGQALHADRGSGHAGAGAGPCGRDTER